jgi:hypothetical protein
VLLLPGIVGIFWPGLWAEAAGAALLVAILALNAAAARRDQPA